MKELVDCDILHSLYLLQVACDLYRQWVIERNRYFASISRPDRFIEHVDGPQIVTNILNWHNLDKDGNVMTGKMISAKGGNFEIRDMLCEIGMTSLIYY